MTVVVRRPRHIWLLPNIQTYAAAALSSLAPWFHLTVQSINSYHRTEHYHFCSTQSPELKTIGSPKDKN
jgi:hypothetical protein